MIRLFKADRCPICENPLTDRQRIRRILWMRIIPKTRHFRCHKCGKRFVVILGFVTVVLREI